MLFIFGILLLAFAAQAEPWLTIDPNSAVTECGYVKFSWGGGKAPYKLTSFALWSIGISKDLQKDSGTDEVQILFPAKYNDYNMKVVFTLEDAGGNFAKPTEVIPIGANVGTPCTLRFKPDFIFSTITGNDIAIAGSVQQCEEVLFNTTLDGNVNNTITFPITMTTVIPGVEAWKKEYPGKVWTVTMNIEKDSKVFFGIRDAVNQQGGTTDLLDVLGGQNTNCLGSTTKGGSNSGSDSGSNNGSSSGSNGSNKLSDGALAGIVVGSVVGAALLIGLVIFFLWRRRSPRDKEVAPFDLYDATIPEPQPFNDRSVTMSSVTHNHHLSPLSNSGHQPVFSVGASSSSDPLAAGPTGTVSSSVGNKSVVARNEPSEPTYLIQTDGGSVPPQPAVIEMPPTYDPDWKAARDAAASAGPSAGPSSAGPSSAALAGSSSLTERDFRLSAQTDSG